MTDREAMLKALDALEILNGAETVDGIFIYTTDEIFALRQALAQPEQKLNDPPAYVEPPTSDYHNGWEEGFEAAKNLFKKESAPQNADPRLLLARKDNCTALAQPEPKSISTNDHLCAMLRQVHDVLACTALPMRRPWVGLTDDEKNNCLVEADPCEALATPEAQELMREVEAKLKEKNNAV